MLQELNDAFAKSDTDTILEMVTDTIRWNIIGEQSVEGKEAFREMLISMQGSEPLELTIHNIITHGKSAAVNGEMKMPGENKAYAFCDVYKFSGFKNPKISEMTSYAIEVIQK